MQGLNYVCLQGSEKTEISDIAYNTAKVSDGSAFVCIKGILHDGHSFAGKAAEGGATCIICSDDIEADEETTVIMVDDTRKALAVISANFFGRPAEKMKLIGVTGTKGKTTTAYMIKAILEKGGYKTGLIGTISIETGVSVISSERTTPESYEIHKYLREMTDCGCRAAVIEVSSQALMLDRIYGIKFDYAVFTNIQNDHIGIAEHKSFEEYLHWKKTLFGMCKTGILNRDDEHFSDISHDAVCKIVTFGFDNKSDIYVDHMSFIKTKGKLGVEFHTKGIYNINLAVNIPGKFTVYNSLAAVAAGSFFDVREADIKEALRTVSVRGREEIISTPNGGVVMIDYAHNGTSLKCLLEALREYHPERLTVLFGCGGERDPARRWEMGEISSGIADFTVVTSDNPRNESPMGIISDIIKGIEKCGGRYVVIPDRREAIFYVVSHCSHGEITVVAGKGHETYQITGNKTIHFDDREEILKSIEKVKNEQTNHR